MSTRSILRGAATVEGPRPRADEGVRRKSCGMRGEVVAEKPCVRDRGEGTSDRQVIERGRRRRRFR